MDVLPIARTVKDVGEGGFHPPFFFCKILLIDYIVRTIFKPSKGLQSRAIGAEKKMTWFEQTEYEALQSRYDLISDMKGIIENFQFILDNEKSYTSSEMMYEVRKRIESLKSRIKVMKLKRDDLIEAMANEGRWPTNRQLCR